MSDLSVAYVYSLTNVILYSCVTNYDVIMRNH